MKHSKEDKRTDEHIEYQKRWGNYKSDKWKKRTILRAEIQDMLHIFHLSKKELSEVKNKILEISLR